MEKEQTQVDQFLRLITEYSASRCSSAEKWKSKYIGEIDGDDVSNFVNTSVDHLADYRLKNSLLYSDLVSNTLLSTDDILLFGSCDKYFRYLLSFKIYGCSQNKIIKFIGKIEQDSENMDQFVILYNIINQNKSKYSDFLLVPTSKFTAAIFREKVLYNHMYHGNKKLSNLLNKDSFYDFILGWDLQNKNYSIFKILSNKIEERVAVAKLSSKKSNKSGTLSQITDFILSSSKINHEHLDDTETVSNKKNIKDKLIKYIILSQLINQNK